ncbi:hypothetical protein B9K06_26840, partial [Bacillus sp. OG2]
YSPDCKYVLFVTDQVMGKLGKIQIFNIDFTKSEQESKPILEIVNEGDATTKPTIATWSYAGKYILVGHADGGISKY